VQAERLEVKLVPQPPEDKAEARPWRGCPIDKQIHGDLEATSKGQMLTAGTDVKGSAGYVAIERITGNAPGSHRQLRAPAQRHSDEGRTAAIHHRRAGFRRGPVWSASPVK